MTRLNNDHNKLHMNNTLTQSFQLNDGFIEHLLNGKHINLWSEDL